MKARLIIIGGYAHKNRIKLNSINRFFVKTARLKKIPHRLNS